MNYKKIQNDVGINKLKISFTLNVFVMKSENIATGMTQNNLFEDQTRKSLADGLVSRPTKIQISLPPLKIKISEQCTAKS